MMRTHINVSTLTKNVDELIDTIDVLIMKADEDLEEELKAEGYVEVKTAVETINALEEGWTAAYNADCDELLEQLEEALSVDGFVKNTWPKLKDESDLRNAIYDVFHDRFFGMLENSVKGFLKNADPAFAEVGTGILSEPAKAFVESWSSDLADLMNLSTKNDIEKILINGQKEHLSVAQVSLNISNSGIRDPGYKARRAAITEVLRAESYGQLESMLQNPAILEKEWEHTGAHKNKPRPNHVAMNGQRVKVDEPFTLTGADGAIYKPMCPRDSNLPAGESINCHCMMNQIRDPKWNDLTIEEKQAAREQRMAELNEEYQMAQSNSNDWSETVPRIVSKEEKDSIVSYAREKGINIVDIKQFDGDAELFKSQIATIAEMQEQYKDLIPKQITVTTRKLDSDTFAQVDNHTIVFDNRALRNREITEMNILEDKHFSFFDAEGIARHECGHLIAAKKGGNSIDIAKQAYYNLKGETVDDAGIVNYLRENISPRSVFYKGDAEEDLFIGKFNTKKYQEVISEVIAKNPQDDFTIEFISLLTEADK